MRARYYEPTSGRFVSEDSGRQGNNWFVYCGNNPLGRSDSSGNFWHLVMAGAAGFLFGALSACSNNQNWIVGGLVGMGSALAGCAFGNPYVAGFVGGFVSSIANDLVTGGIGSVNIGKAIAVGILGAGMGGLAAKIMGSVFSSQFNIAKELTGEGVETSMESASKQSEAALDACMGVFAEGAFSTFYGG